MTFDLKKYAEESQKAAADFFIEGLRDGSASFVKSWDGSNYPDMHHNPVTGTRYRGGNMALLEVSLHRLAKDGADPHDTRWMTFKNTGDAGGKVIKGSKATFIWSVPRLVSVKAKVEGEDDHSYKTCSVIPVFHASQIAGLPPIARLPERPLDERIAGAMEVAEKTGADIRYGGGRAYYSPGTDHVQMPQREAFTGDPAFASVLLHELGHWTGASSRLDRKFGKKFGDELYSREELRAEIASYLGCQRLQIPFDPSSHQGYVNSWIKNLESDPSEILRAVRDASEIVDYLKVPEREIDLLPKVEREKPLEQEVKRSVGHSR
jgi:putative DNA primase/helicase